MSSSSHDFTHHKPKAIVARSARRIALARFCHANIDYDFDFPHDSDNKQELLAKTLLINVTTFFGHTELP
ncbi:MAG: hypothetical protein ACP5QR_09420 [Rhizomicrobium sp.]